MGGLLKDDELGAWNTTRQCPPIIEPAQDVLVSDNHERSTLDLVEASSRIHSS